MSTNAPFSNVQAPTTSSTAPLVGIYNTDQMPSLTFQAGATISGGVVVTSPPQAVGSALAITSSMQDLPILLNIAAGSTATLPAATGSGATYYFYVTTTASSNAHKILPASVADFMQGHATGHVAAGTTLTFAGNPAASHSLQMPFAGTQPSGGFAGDWFEVTDVATGMWSVKSQYQSGTTSTTPFSAATT